MDKVLNLATVKPNQALKDSLIVIGASLILSLVSQLSIPLFFTPVPIILQNTLAVIMGITLGKKRGTLAVALYLLQGAMGLPVFASGGAGLGVLLGYRGGYLFGYLIATYIAGHLTEKKPTLTRKYAALFIGSGTILLSGMLYLSLFVGGLKQALLLGVLPFLFGDLLKIYLLSGLFRIHRKMNPSSCGSL